MFFNSEVFQITLLSLQISAGATMLSLLLGLPLGTLLALGRFPGRSVLLSLVNTGMGLPPVVVGLFVAMMLRPCASYVNRVTPVVGFVQVSTCPRPLYVPVQCMPPWSV